MTLEPLFWQDGVLVMLDQTKLPGESTYLNLRSHLEVTEAIKNMAVRGAPAIGLAAAYGMVLAAQNNINLVSAGEVLVAARPTAINLQWAVQRILSLGTDNPEIVLQEAQRIEREDFAMSEKIGTNGSTVVPQKANILTICNTGALATAGIGTALGIIRKAHSQNKNIHVWSCETRPRQQGLKLTAYELLHEGIPFHSIADFAAGYLMAQNKVDIVIAGADRIARNGDTVNKIGTYTLAILAQFHKIPFYIAAPSSTFDPYCKEGKLIPIEERNPIELLQSNGQFIAPERTPVYNPGFDCTPGEIITGIITEKGIFTPPYSFPESPTK